MNSNVIKPSDPDFLAYRNRIKNRDHLMAVRGVGAYRDELDDLLDNPPSERGTPMPWQNTASKVRIRPGELSLWAGKNSHGKSTLLAQVLTWLAAMGEPVMVASFEMGVIQTLEKMVKQATGVANPTPKARDEFFRHFEHKIFFYDYVGRVDADLVLDLCEFASDVLECKHIQIDSLSKVKGMLGDDNALQADFVNDLHSSCKYFGTHIHLVAHERKGMAGSEKNISSRYEIKGSGAIPDQVDNVFMVWRDKDAAQSPDGDEDPDFFIRVDKQRHGTWEGYIPLWQPNILNFQFVPSSNRRSMHCPGMPI